MTGWPLFSAGAAEKFGQRAEINTLTELDVWSKVQQSLQNPVPFAALGQLF